jgi:hypothetical protein
MAKLGRIAAIGGGLVALAGATTALFAYREKSVEQPTYSIVESDGAIEVRDYPALLVAETVNPGDRLSSLNAGFKKLADYIFAKRRGPSAGAADSGERIAMTAPVLSDRTDRGQWRTRFVMPARFSKDTLPTPDGGIAIDEVPARRMAAIRFSGTGSDSALADQERTLRVWLAQHGYQPIGPAEHAFYNSPFVAPPLRHNEVLVPVAA